MPFSLIDIPPGMANGHALECPPQGSSDLNRNKEMVDPVERANQLMGVHLYCRTAVPPEVARKRSSVCCQPDGRGYGMPITEPSI